MSSAITSETLAEVSLTAISSTVSVNPSVSTDRVPVLRSSINVAIYLSIIVRSWIEGAVSHQNTHLFLIPSFDPPTNVRNPPISARDLSARIAKSKCPLSQK